MSEWDALAVCVFGQFWAFANLRNPLDEQCHCFFVHSFELTLQKPINKRKLISITTIVFDEVVQGLKRIKEQGFPSICEARYFLFGLWRFEAKICRKFIRSISVSLTSQSPSLLSSSLLEEQHAFYSYQPYIWELRRALEHIAAHFLRTTFFKTSS